MRLSAVVLVAMSTLAIAAPTPMGSSNSKVTDIAEADLINEDLEEPTPKRVKPSRSKKLLPSEFSDLEFNSADEEPTKPSRSKKLSPSEFADLGFPSDVNPKMSADDEVPSRRNSNPLTSSEIFALQAKINKKQKDEDDAFQQREDTKKRPLKSKKVADVGF